MYPLRLIGSFIRISTLNALAYRTNFAISLLHALLNLATGVLGVAVVFGQVETIQGWDFDATLVILGVYLVVSAMRSLFISPSLDALAGLGGEIWDGRFDFTLLQPVDVQFLVSLRHWRPLALFDLVLGLGTLGVAMARLGETLTPQQVAAFVLTLGAGLATLYAILLAFAALVFWSPGFLFTWLFDGLMQLARYPTGLYPGWLRLVLTWVVPVGIVTTVPAQALTGQLSGGMLAASLGIALVAFGGASVFFRRAVGRYASASS